MAPAGVRPLHRVGETMSKRTKKLPTTTEPSFQTLDGPGVREILARNHVGRLAFSHMTYVDIEPIHYVFADDIVHFRTAPGSKLATFAHNPWVAFEVDEIDGKFDWRSVVLHGVVYVIEDGELPTQHADYEATLAHLRTFIPETLRRGDPAPFRSVLLRLFVQTASGRAATTKAPPSAVRRTRGSVAGYSGYCRYIAWLRSQRLARHRSSGRHACRNHRQAQQGNQPGPRRSSHASAHRRSWRQNLLNLAG